MGDIEVTADETIAGFEPAQTDEPEIVVLGPDGKPPSEAAAAEEKKQVVLTPEEFEALKTKGNESSALRESIAALGESMRAPINTQVQEQQQPGETDQQFRDRIEKEIFETGKTTGALQEAIGRFVGPYFQQTLGTISEQSKKLLETDPARGPTYKKYQKEIEDYVNKLPPQQRALNPNVWEHAYEAAVRRHSEDIVQERIQEGVKKALKEMGIEPGGKKAPAAVGTGQGSSMAVPEAQGVKRKTQIHVTPDQKSALERSAEIRGVDLAVYMQTTAGQEELRRLKNAR